MLRILVEADHNEATVALHGRLSASEVSEVDEVISLQNKPVTIDLAHLTGADSEGFQALRRLRDAGVRVTEASPFVEMMLERTEAAGRPGEPARPADPAAS